MESIVRLLLVITILTIITSVTFSFLRLQPLFCITYLYFANSILVEFNFRKFYDGPHKYDKVILLVRDPFDTLLAEWNRQNSGESHTGIAPIKSFSDKVKKI